MKRLLVEEEAERELAESASYYEQRRTGLGREFEASIREALSNIRESPERYSLRKNGTRRYVMRRFPFIIHFLVGQDYIWIVAFAHASRRPDYWRRRLGLD